MAAKKDTVMQAMRWTLTVPVVLVVIALELAQEKGFEELTLLLQGTSK